jgi:hypothetical protein
MRTPTQISDQPGGGARVLYLGGGAKTVTWIWVAIALGGIVVAAVYALCVAAAAGDVAMSKRTEPPTATADALARLTPGVERLAVLSAQMLAADLVAIALDDGVWCWDGTQSRLGHHPAGTDPAGLVHVARGTISAPLGDDAAPVGRLTVVSTQNERSFSGRELALLGTLADGCTAALRVTGAGVSEIAAYVDALATSLGPDRAELRWRGGDFVALVAAVGRRVELSDAEQAEAELAARLLDIGMLRVPIAVLDRDGPLTTAEEHLVRRHSAWGAEALLSVPGLAAVAMLVLCHHERWDGTGYPHGLAGERIPLAARVLAGCDAWWAMTSHRAFAGPRRPEEAIEELIAAWGRQLDVRVVEALLAEVAGETLVA